LGITKAEMSFEIDNKTMVKGYMKKWSLMNLILYLMGDPGIYSHSENGYSCFYALYNAGQAFGGLYASAEGLIKILRDLLKKDSRLLSLNAKTLLFTQPLHAMIEYLYHDRL
jgi:hypothetical protein